MYSTAHHESEIEKMEASDEIVWRQSYASFQELLQPQRATSKRLRSYCITKGFLLNRFDVQKRR